MKAVAVTRVSIAAPPAAVFKYLGHLKFHQLWNPHIVRITPQVRLKKGLIYQTDSLLFGVKIRAANEVTDLVDGKVLELANNTGLLIYTVRYALRPQDGGTTVTCKTHVSTQSPAFSFAKPMMDALARRELQSDLQLLKTVVEQGISV